MTKLSASLAPAGRSGAAAHPFARVSLDAPGLTVLMARDGEAKARLLGSLRHDLAASVATAATNGSAAAQASFICIQDPSWTEGLTGPGSAGRLDAGVAERHAAAAIGDLRAGAALLLASDGSGRIAELLERLRQLDDRLAVAVQSESAVRALCEARLASAAGFAAVVRERDRITAERAHWRALIRLWPDWQRLQQIRHELAAASRFERFPPDAEARHAALEERWTMVQRAVREAEQRVRQLREEAERVRPAVERLAPGAAENAARLCAELPGYRSRLLQLATARARLAELERTLAAGVEQLGRAWDVARVSDTVLADVHSDELRRWQQRSRHIEAEHADAERAQTDARQRVRALCDQVSAQLGRAPDDGDTDIDARWRVLWTLRANLEEIWDVQSSAESTARTLAEREEAQRRLDATRYWTAPRWLLSLLTGLAALGTGTLASGIVDGRLAMAGLAAVVLALIAARVAGHLRARWVGVQEQRGAASGERMHREIATLRRQRDGAWTRAAQLTASIRAASARLSLPDPVTPEAVDACEHELAARLRAEGASSELTGLLLDLVTAQDDEQQAAARLTDAGAHRQGLAGEWDAWRAEAGFPHDIELERIEERLAELQRLTEVRAARDAARTELLSIEPVTAAWEADARGALAHAGVEIQPQLCGSALAAELAALAARGRADVERRARGARIAAELPDAERQLAEAEGELTRAGAERRELLTATGAADGAALAALLEGLRHWRAGAERARRLEAAIEERLNRLTSPAAAGEQLAKGERKQWYTELQRCKVELTDVTAQLDELEPRQRAAEDSLDAARASTEVAALRCEREVVLAQLHAAAREWKVSVLAAALLETALLEQRRAGHDEVLQAASRALALLTRGLYTGLARSEPPAELVLIDRAGTRVPVGVELGQPVLAHVRLSLTLGRAAQLAKRDPALPLVVDDLLGPLPLDDAHLVAQELAAIARAHPVVYLTTAARRGSVLSVLPAGTAVVEIE